MNEHILSVREIQERDIILITQYWLTADHRFLINMGVDVTKISTEVE